MTELLDSNKVHPYYKYVTEHMDLKEPVVFLKNNQALVEPINTTSIDIQVYHPVTEYINGRPSWLLFENNHIYALPQAFSEYDGHLLQAVPVGESTDAVPVDQFVISPEKRSLVLPPGQYDLRIIDCEGTLVGKSAVSIE